MTDMQPYMASHLTAAGAEWRKASYSDGAGNNCVEIADLSTTAYRGVAIRDSQDPDGPALLVHPAEFRAFLALVRSGGGDFGMLS